VTLYLDTNVFYNAYCPVEHHESADWLLTQLTESFNGITCEWTLIEMFRALKKQVNLGYIAEEDAIVALDFFLSDVGELSQKRVLKLVSVSRSAIIASRKQIFERNLYAADALHATIAMASEVRGFITYDSDFRGNLGVVPLINPTDSSFKNRILKMKQELIDKQDI
jgi:predicted nucleic acid-binding protein